MQRKLLQTTHAVTAVIAPLLILTFLIATIVAEINGSLALIVMVKRDIAYSLLLLLPTMAALGISGTRLSNHQSTLESTKKLRMAFIAANGVLVLVPCALSLYWLANHGLIDSRFYIIQALELTFGCVNLILIALSIRDGLKLSGHMPKQRAAL